MELSNKYIKYLKDGFYKTLCLFEENNDYLSLYINSFLYELYGLQYVINEEKVHILTSLVSILEHLYDDSFQPEPDLTLIRSEIFHCTNNLIDKLFEVGDR